MTTTGRAASTVGARLAEAVNTGDLVAVVHGLLDGPGGSADERDLVEQAARALRAIGREAIAAYRVLADSLSRAGVGHEPLGPLAGALAAPEPELARIAIDVRVTEADAPAAVEAAVSAGYRPWYTLGPGAWTAYRHLYPALPLVTETSSGHPILLQVSWRAAEPGAAPGDRGTVGRRPTRLRPAPQDLEAVALPARLWLGYLPVRPLRALGRRLLRRPAPPDLGPYLPTPTGLVDALLDVASAGPGDVVADVGCGDGRVLVAAARRGCRAIGVERDPMLVERARARAASAGLADRVSVVCGEAATFDVSSATVVVLFLSAPMLPAVITELRARLRPGSRILAHEQAPLPVHADHRQPIFSPAGITVAHRWEL